MRDLSYRIELDIKVLGGLPITVLVYMLPAEYDNGISGDYVDDWEITHINNKPVSPPIWLYKRLESARVDEVMEAIHFALEDYAMGDYDHA